MTATTFTVEVAREADTDAITNRMIDALDAMFDCPTLPLADFTADGYPCANGTAADGREFGAEVVDYPTPTTATVIVHVYEGDE